jgi:hypothetical protein
MVIVAAVIVWRALAARRTRSLQQQFGPEYDRTTKIAGGRRQAEAELAARQDRRERLTISPLTDEAHARYAAQWETVQAQFVDSPQMAIASADGLVNAVMSDRGYPMNDFEQRAADVSVDHPEVVENYRQARAISLRAERGEAATEDLRQAMQHYRSLFNELLSDSGADQPLAREVANDVSGMPLDTRSDAASTERTVRR